MQKRRMQKRLLQDAYAQEAINALRMQKRHALIT
jgi:hypothetical protein